MDRVNILHLEDHTVGALPLSDSLSVFVGDLQLTKETDNLVAVVALLGFDRNLLADHTR